MRKMAVLAAALAVGGVCTPAMAHEGGAYIRAEAGNSQFDFDAGSLDSTDGDDTSGNVRGGYWFTPNFAVEAFYSRYGEDGDDGARAEFDGVGLGLVAKKNFGADGNGFYINGRAGAVQARTDLGVSGIGSIDDKDVVPYVGIGVGYDFTDAFGLGLNYDHVRSEADFGNGVEIDIKTRTLTLSLEYRFVF